MPTPRQPKTFEGVVVSNKMNKTIVVRVERLGLHPKNQLQHPTRKTFKVHDEQHAHRGGDRVRFVETRPISKEKRWRVIGKVS